MSLGVIDDGSLLFSFFCAYFAQQLALNGVKENGFCVDNPAEHINGDHRRQYE